MTDKLEIITKEGKGIAIFLSPKVNPPQKPSILTAIAIKTKVNMLMPTTSKYLLLIGYGGYILIATAGFERN
jgi:hypothetical protein